MWRCLQGFQLQRLVCSAFLHANETHLLLNMSSLLWKVSMPGQKLGQVEGRSRMQRSCARTNLQHAQLKSLKTNHINLYASPKLVCQGRPCLLLQCVAISMADTNSLLLPASKRQGMGKRPASYLDLTVHACRAASWSPSWAQLDFWHWWASFLFYLTACWWPWHGWHPAVRLPWPISTTTRVPWASARSSLG